MWLRDIVVNSGGQGRDVEYSPNSGRPGGQQLLTGRPMDDARNTVITIESLTILNYTLIYLQLSSYIEVASVSVD